MKDVVVTEGQKSDIEIIAPAAQQAVVRNVAVDAYRGLVMVLMMA